MAIPIPKPKPWAMARLILALCLLITSAVAAKAEYVRYEIDNIVYALRPADTNDTTEYYYRNGLTACGTATLTSDIKIPSSVIITDTEGNQHNVIVRDFMFKRAEQDYNNIKPFYTLWDNTVVETMTFGEGIDFDGAIFSGCTSLKTVHMPERVSEIHNSLFSSAFENCTALTSINIPLNITSIGNNAFKGCTSLKEINLDHVEEIRFFAFAGCTSLKSVSVPNLKSLEDSGFRDSGIESISLPNTITKIEYGAFAGCPNLKEFTIPSSVEEIEDYAFAKSGIESITIPEGVNTIGADAFRETPIKAFKTPSGLTSIGIQAFYECKQLTSVDLGDSQLSEIPQSILYGCSSLESIIFPKSLTTIADYAFQGCGNIKSLDFPDQLQSIGNAAFSIYNDGQQPSRKLTLPASIETIEENAFYDMRFDEITIPASLKVINPNVFRGSMVSKLNLENGIETIDSYAFSGNNLSFVTIPASVKEMGSGPFRNFDSEKVAVIYFESPEPPVIPSDFFSDIVLIPVGAYDAYSSTVGFNRRPQEMIAGLELISQPSDLNVGDTFSTGSCISNVYIKNRAHAYDHLTFSVLNPELFEVVKDFGEDGKMVIQAKKTGETAIRVSAYYQPDVYVDVPITITKTGVDIQYPTDPVSVPLYNGFYLSTLIQSRLISGININEAGNYTIESDNSSVIQISDNGTAPHAYARNLGSVNLTFTNKESDDSFTIPFAVANGLNIGRLNIVYVGDSVTAVIESDIQIEDGSFTLNGYDEYAQLEQAGNSLTISGIKEGRARLSWQYANSIEGYHWLTIAKKPNIDDIIVTKTPVNIPTGMAIRLSSLLMSGYVSGIDDRTCDDYTVSSDNPDILDCVNGGDPYFSYFMTLKSGKANVTYTSNSDSSLSFTVPVNIMEAVNLSQVSEQIDTIYVGESSTIVIDTDYPADEIRFNTYSSYENGGEATLTQDGLKVTLTGITEGDVELQCLYTNLSVAHSVALHVAKRQELIEVVDGAATAGTQLGVPVTIELPDNVDLSTSEGETIVWESENTGIAEVDPATGAVTPKALGKTIITVKRVSQSSIVSRAGEQSETLVTIEFWVTELKVVDSVEITEGDNTILSYSVDAGRDIYPYDINATWTSSAPDIASVDSRGNLNAKSVGTAIITLNTKIGTKQITVTVNKGDDEPEVTEINLDTEKISGVEGTTYHLQADVDDLTWSSSDESVAVVDQNGIVTLVGAGRAIITATAPNGVKATCEVVVEAASGIDGVEADTEAAFAPVYDLTGRIVARTPEQMAALRAGIYIQSGRKIYISK
jgi:uncharacterized protein YjdB